MSINEKMLLAISVNKGCCSHQAITLQPPLPNTVSPEETGCKENAHHQVVRHSSHLQRCTLRRLRMGKHRILATDSWCSYKRNGSREPRVLHLPIYWKVLNFSTWSVWFSLINRSLSIFWLLHPCCKNSSVSWFLPYFRTALRAKGED